MRALCWPQEDINRRIDKKLLGYPGCIYEVKPHPAWIHLYLPMHDCQCVVQHEAWGCHQHAPVQLDLRGCQLSPACSHCWRNPWRGLPLWGRSLTSFGLAACWLKMPYAFLRGISRRLEITGALIPFPLGAITLQCCRIVVRGIFRAISKVLHVLPSHTQRRF